MAADRDDTVLHDIVLNDTALGDTALGDTVIVPPRVAPTRSEQDTDDTIIVDRARPTPAPRREQSMPAQARVYYSFRLGEGTEAIGLDRPAYVGRRPSPPRVVTGSAPRLVRVASPLHEVSASHVEIRQLGASVIVTDLKSTNGTVVLLPGSVPRKLLQGESVVVSPGTLVDIGDHNILQILPMQRLG